MEPIIRAENEEEIVFVFCNRCGIEGDTVYAGTSTVISIKQGECRVHGLLPRGRESLLVVDTDNPPLGKLISRADTDAESDTLPEDASVHTASADGVPRSGSP
jgi:protein N-terminal amidase